jgi:hypothetical protein
MLLVDAPVVALAAVLLRLLRGIVDLTNVKLLDFDVIDHFPVCALLVDRALVTFSRGVVFEASFVMRVRGQASLLLSI